MERYPFSIGLTVRGFDCDAAGHLRASAALRYLQEAAGSHLESLGIGFERMREEGVFFVLVGQALRFGRAPRRGERLTVATAPALTQGARMCRETVLLDEAGTLLVEHQTAWALLDLETGRPMRSSSFRHKLPMLHGEWTPFIDPSRLKIPPSDTPCGERPVRLSDLDVNCHVNNAVYADIALDCFPDELPGAGGVERLLLRYQRQARLGETIALRRKIEADCLLVEGTIEDSLCFSAQISLLPLATGDLE